MAPDNTGNEEPDPKKGSPIQINSDDHTLVDVPDTGGEPSRTRGSDVDMSDFSASVRDRYRLIRVLGKGGFGIVYLAHDRVLDQDVAIKILKFGLSTENDRQRFIFEARTGAKLRHPAIVNVFDIIQTEEGLQLVMEYYPGGTLSQLIKREGALPLLQALDYTKQIAAGLAYAHKKNIIHRDIKPANVFLAGDDIVKLGDFGICAHYETHDHTMTGEIIGTPLYMAPEQTRNAKDVDPRSDLYALGMTLYHMLSGHPPRVVDLDGFDPDVKSFSKKVTAYERRDRPVSAEQLMHMIDRLVAARGAKLHTPQVSANTATPATPSTPAGGTASGVEATPSSISTPTSEHSFAGPDDVTVTQGAARNGSSAHRSVGWSVVALAAVIVGGIVAGIYILNQKRDGAEPGTQIAAQASAAAPGGSVAMPALPREPETAGVPPESPRDETPLEVPPRDAPAQEEVSDTADAPESTPEQSAPDADSSPVDVEPLGPQPPPAANVEPEPIVTPDIDPQAFIEQKQKELEAKKAGELALKNFLDYQESPLLYRTFARDALENAARLSPRDPLYPFLLMHLAFDENDEAKGSAARADVLELDRDFTKNLNIDRLVEMFASRGVTVDEKQRKRLLPLTDAPKRVETH